MSQKTRKSHPVIPKSERWMNGPHQNEPPGLGKKSGIQQGKPLAMLGNQTGPQLLDAYELLSLWLFYPFFLFVAPKETSSSFNFEFVGSKLPQKKNSSSEHVKTEHCDPSP